MTTEDTGGSRERLSESVYAQVKTELFEFVLMPGARFSENEIAQRLGVSRTPVREALSRLGQEGFLQVASKSGWTVKPLDFQYFDELYDLRVIVETAAVQRFCDRDPLPPMQELRDAWLVPPDERLGDSTELAALDESFHASIVLAAGNSQLARIHRDVTERIRVLRRLDFAYDERVKTTYAQHAQILRALLRRKPEQAAMLLRAHIEESKAEVRKIGLHRLFERKAPPPTRSR